MWDLQLFDQPADVLDHVVESFVGAIGMFHDHHFYFVKLMQAVQAAYILSIARLSSKAWRVGGVPPGKIFFLEDIAPVKIGLRVTSAVGMQ